MGAGAAYDPGSGASRMRWPSGVLRGFEINPESPAPIRHCCDQQVSGSAAVDANAHLMKLLPLLWPLRNPRPLDKETEIFPGNGLPYAGGGGPLDPAKSVNTAWDAK